MRLFPFSLRDDAKGWFLKLQPRSIRSWDELTDTFLDAYYPPHKTTSMRHELLLFAQRDHETFWEAWDRYKDICNACPHHGLTKSMMIDGFYGGLLPHERRRVDVAAQGSLHSHGQTEAWDILEHLGRQSRQWDDHDSRRERLRKDPYYDTKSTHETRVAQESSSVDYRKLERKLDLLLQAQEHPTHHVKAASMPSSICLLCESPTHATSECHFASSYPDFVDEHAKAVGSFPNRPRNDPYSSTYNPGWRNHPNFSWRDSGGSSSAQQGGVYSYGGQQGPHSSFLGSHGQGSSFGASHGGSYGSHAQNAPPGFQNRQVLQGVPNTTQEPTKNHMEELLTALTKSQMKTEQNISVLTQSQSSLAQSVGKLEVQMGQLARELGSRPQGALPTQPDPNPRHEQAKAITTLRSGRIYDNK
ncbi:uncharacterized protein LOC121051252 [Rosa chinensis]|uniref:uncharacterized protein LOC121051252 n=1 Tax=Rosa chinensis TaxID=74649 RepID=UPI001AD8BFA3|nr:uncharacterized protein LOC121051252 [Rosa chinensis]